MYHYEYIETVLSQGIFLCRFFFNSSQLPWKVAFPRFQFGLALEDESDCMEDDKEIAKMVQSSQ